MNVLRNRLRAVLLAVAVMTLAVPAREVVAGCLSEYQSCTDCAREMIWEGMKHLSPSDLVQADLMLADCSIDLYHCVAFHGHHEYPCRI